MIETDVHNSIYKIQIFSKVVCLADFSIYSNSEQTWDKKVAVCVNFIPRMRVCFTPRLFSLINSKEVIVHGI